MGLFGFLPGLSDRDSPSDATLGMNFLTGPVKGSLWSHQRRNTQIGQKTNFNKFNICGKAFGKINKTFLTLLDGFID